MNQERDNEGRAKRVVEQVMGLDLNHADTHGGVDYLSPDGTVAVEVTTVTEGDRKRSRAQLAVSKEKGAPAVQLQGCWIVLASDTNVGMRSFIQQVKPAIAELELAGEGEFHHQPAAVHVLEEGALSFIYRPLLDAGVERAEHLPHATRPDDPDHVHQVHVSTGSGGSASGSDEALDRIVAELNRKLDNAKKLHESRAQHRHLFVWVDGDSEFAIARPLDRDIPDWVDASWGLPSAAPQIDPVVTHLWVVHQSTGRGWLWNGTIWRELTNP